MNEAVIIEAVAHAVRQARGALREQRPNTVAGACSRWTHRAVADRSTQDRRRDRRHGDARRRAGRHPARLAVLLSAITGESAGRVVDRMCGSSQQAVPFRPQAVAAGDMNYVIGCAGRA